jgi:hypothetical protein
MNIYPEVVNKTEKLENLKKIYCDLWTMAWHGKYQALIKTFNDIIDLECELIAKGKFNPEDMTV